MRKIKITNLGVQFIHENYVECFVSAFLQCQLICFVLFLIIKFSCVG